MLNIAFNIDSDQLTKKIAVLILEGSDKATIEKYVMVEIFSFLKPFNPAYPTAQVMVTSKLLAFVCNNLIEKCFFQQS